MLTLYPAVDEPKGYKWVPINALSNTQALNNADSYGKAFTLIPHVSSYTSQSY